MTHTIIADRAGVWLDDVTALSRGKATANVANRLGVTTDDVESFIKGATTANMTNRLGFGGMTSAADELAKMNGPNGAIGIVYTLLTTVDQ